MSLRPACNAGPLPTVFPGRGWGAATALGGTRQWVIELTLAALVLAPAAAAALVSPVPASAATHDQSGGGEDCSIALSVSPITPAMSYAPGQATYRMSGFTDCGSTGAQTLHGTITGTGSGIVGCSGGLRDAALTIAWANGLTSVEHLQFGEFLYGAGAFGSVAGGYLNGSSVGMALARRAGGAEALCVTGITSYGMAGEMAIAGFGGGAGGGGSAGNGGDNGGTAAGNPGAGSGGAAGAAGVPPATGVVRASASAPATGAGLSPAIPATGIGAAALLAGVGLVGFGAALLTQLALR